MSDTRFSSASVAMVNSTRLLSNYKSTLMMPSIVTPALQQAQVPYPACNLPCKSHHSALFFCFTIWDKFHVCLHCQGPGFWSYNAAPITLAWPCHNRSRRNQKIRWMVSTCIFQYCNKLLHFIISYSYTQPLNGTKILSYTVLCYCKVTLNVHYIEQ